MTRHAVPALLAWRLVLVPLRNSESPRYGTGLVSLELLPGFKKKMAPGRLSRGLPALPHEFDITPIASKLACELIRTALKLHTRDSIFHTSEYPEIPKWNPERPPIIGINLRLCPYEYSVI